MMELTKAEKIQNTAEKIIKIAHDTIIMNMRFLEIAMSALTWVPQSGSAMISCDGNKIYYDPALMIRKYRGNQNSIVRLYLHILLHCIFHHNYEYERMHTKEWDMAVDIAVEATVLEMNLYHGQEEADAKRVQKLQTLQKRAGGLSAQRLYRLFRVEEPSEKEQELLYSLFHRDEHMLWETKPTLDISLEQWKKISERVKADLKSFSKNKSGSESLAQNLDEATREKVDYRGFLNRFMTSGEDIHVNDDEFDYIFYTYGLREYGNMPLVEPLEYKDVQKIHDFVIAIDTSASCRGSIVKAFLKITWQIMQSKESFFQKFNVHIIQCDSEIQSDTKITNEQEFEAFLQNGKLNGFGSTDFRPVFEYVEELRANKEFDSLKGLIYFTDGYGTYPSYMPEYDTAFVFLQDDDKAPRVPAWAIKVVLDGEMLEEQVVE